MRGACPGLFLSAARAMSGTAYGWLGLGMLVCLSLGWALALVPFSLEAIRPSMDLQEHRRRLRALGPPGVLAVFLLPRRQAGLNPARFWGAACHLALGA